ncbi:cell cycle control ATPase [Herbaspirillum rubrisubalbicans M1]|uniref:tRNA 2-thiocytidine(32) synthetase TtcA n=1 Tax=Herbaspirillum rubrisubalbicans TaxID=80842 RepID=UPI00073A9FFB|nr:tRNA 2-thiocytidine(32) synthetase TtcA [Herbaspirillum rubrisubalbicans]ALU91489.1 cell cycle control ATPase [Herbaspirillum rubrisubalbicans M1]
MNDIAATVQLSDLAELDDLPTQGESGQPEVSARGSRRFEILEKGIRRLTGRAIADFDMIRDGDVIMACMSGGADSYTMLDTLRYLQTVAPVKFEIIAVNLDQKQPGFPEHILPEYFERIGVRYRIVEEDTYSIVKEKIAPGKTTCSLCSRLRRGILYRVAKELGATKIALGHHRDDILHTFMLNMFYGGKIKTMPPKLIADDGENVVIRPLAYVREPDIKKYAAAMQFPIIPCNLCGSQPNLQRQAMREMLNQWEKTNPLWIKSMFTAMANIAPSHMLDRSLFDFSSFKPGAGKEATGDTLFDRDDKLDQGQSVINLL